MGNKEIDWSLRPELQEMVNDGIITMTQAREVILKVKKEEDEKKRDEIQALFANVIERWRSSVKELAWRNTECMCSGRPG